MNNGFCNYFTADPILGSGLVSSDCHEAGDGPLFFFVSLGNGDAVRVAVCEEHAVALARLHEEHSADA